MKFVTGDKVWAISTGPNLSAPTGEFAGVIIGFHGYAESPRGELEMYVVDIPEVKGELGATEWVIGHIWLRPRDDFEDPPGDTDATPKNKSSWDNCVWNPTKVPAVV